MSLEERCWKRIRDLAFDSLLDDGSLLLAPCHEAYLLRREDGRNAHSESARWQLLHSDVLCSLIARSRVDENEASHRTDSRTWLIHCDVAFTSDAEQCKVDTSKTLDRLLVVAAVFGHSTWLDCSVESNNILRSDIHVRDKQLVDVLESRTRILLVERIILVEVDDHYVLEAETGLIVTADEFSEQWSQSQASTKTDDAVLELLFSLTDESFNLIGNLAYTIIGSLEDLSRNLLEASESRTFQSILRLVVTWRDIVERDLRAEIRSENQILIFHFCVFDRLVKYDIL